MTMTIVIIFLTILLLLIGTVIGAGHYAFSIKPKSSSIDPTSLNLRFQDIYFQNYDGEVLHAWWLPADEGASRQRYPALVMLHGWNRNCQRMIPYLEHLHDFPVNFLVIEGRGHGENEKNRFISQVGFTQDLSAAINWLVIQREVDVSRIGVLGHSIGAAATINAVATDPRISTFIADSSYANPKEIITRMLQDKHIPFFPLGWLMQQYIQIRLGTTFDKVAPENVVTRISKPGLLIHGSKDEVVPINDLKRILHNCGDNIEYWIADNRNHSNTTDHPDFPRVVRNFLKQTMLNPTDNEFNHADQDNYSL